MKQLKWALSVFISAFLAGVMISIGGTIYLKMVPLGLSYVGALLFSIGLYTILAFSFHLFTGKVGYLFLPDASMIEKLSELLMTLIGNFAGTMLMGTLLKNYLTETSPVSMIVDAKLNTSLGRIFLLAVLCGILMCVAVYGYKTVTSDATRVILVVFAVGGFILAGFEHSIADMFYVAAAGKFNGESAGMLFVIIAGNLVGGAGFGFLSQFFKEIPFLGETEDENQ